MLFIFTTIALALDPTYLQEFKIIEGFYRGWECQAVAYIPEDKEVKCNVGRREKGMFMTELFEVRIKETFLEAK